MQVALATSSIAAVSPNHDSNALRRHTTEFEGILLSQWLESAEKTFAAPPDQSSDPASETLSGLGSQALGQALAKENVLGIGRMIAESLAHSKTQVDQQTATKAVD